MRKLGEGDYGIVYSARRVQSMENSLVAIKVCKEACSSQEIDIMRYLGGCNETCVMPILDAFASAWLTAIVMPLFGRSLRQFFKSQPTGTNTAHGSIARGVAKGLAHMHCKGILHLDLHAGNVMLTDLDSDPKVCVSDFGMVESTTWPFQEPSFDHLHHKWDRAPELFMAGSLRAVGSDQRIVFDAPPSADIKPCSDQLSTCGLLAFFWVSFRRHSRLVVTRSSPTSPWGWISLGTSYRRCSLGWVCLPVTPRFSDMQGDVCEGVTFPCGSAGATSAMS